MYLVLFQVLDSNNFMTQYHPLQMRKLGTERLFTLLKVTQLASGRARIYFPGSLAVEPTF